MITLIIIFLSILIDQLTKLYVVSISNNSFPINLISDYLRLTYITNEGIAFGLNPFGQYTIVLLVISIVAVFFIIKLLIDSKEHSMIIQLGLSFIIGGAIGNLIDRFFTSFNMFNYSGVIDFIDIGINNYRFYIFNFADFFISIGIILYLFSFIINNSLNDKK